MTVLQRGSDTTDGFLSKGNYYMFVFCVLVCSRRCVTDGHRLPLHPAHQVSSLLGAWPRGEGGCEVHCAKEQAVCSRPEFKPRDAICSWRMKRI